MPYLQGKNVMAAFKTTPAIALPVSKYDSFAEGYMSNAIIPVVNGEKDINSALREAEEHISKNIDANRQK